MSILNEFKAFAMRGNVIDLAVAVVIGAAFGKIIASLVDGIIMPIIGLLLGGINISSYVITFHQASFQWGLFLQSVIDFTIIAFAIFLAIKAINMFKKKEQEAAPKLSGEEKLLIEIRDLLKNKSSEADSKLK
jgi:large conductance mechanosensitive channel